MAKVTNSGQPANDDFPEYYPGYDEMSVPNFLLWSNEWGVGITLTNNDSGSLRQLGGCSVSITVDNSGCLQM